MYKMCIVSGMCADFLFCLPALQTSADADYLKVPVSAQLISRSINHFYRVALLDCLSAFTVTYKPK